MSLAVSQRCFTDRILPDLDDACVSPSRPTRVRVKGRVFYIPTAQPKPDTAYLVRVGFSHHGIGSRPFGSTATGESRNGKIEATPKEVHGAGLADEI